MEQVMPAPWACPRCRTAWAPWIDQCTCRPEPNTRKLSATTRAFIEQRDDLTCQYCGRAYRSGEPPMHVDHLVPRIAGGSNDPSNLVLACPSCNLSKGSRMPEVVR